MSTRPTAFRTAFLALMVSGAIACGSTPVAPTTRAHPPRSDRASALHLLNRFGFGPRSDDLESVGHIGARAWLESQLHPEQIADPAGRAALAPFADALRPPPELYAEFEAREDDRGALNARARTSDSTMVAAPAAASTSTPAAPVQTEAMRARQQDLNSLLAQFQMSAIARAITSDRQVLEVMTDFWTNHFNVFARKGPVQWLAADYVERAIRPHALGHFEELLIATARHPAMLVYLDNWRSTAEGEVYGPNRRRRGINENYARELLELHTLGVDGGYSQDDVVSVARILTGWTMSAPEEGQFVFEFRAGWHDRGDKSALGVQFPAGGGEDEGMRLLHVLAEHPSTARFVARKLVQRFVADEPPAALVQIVAETYRDTHGDIAAMLRTIAQSDAFWARENRGNKVKTPLEFVASALRVIGAQPDGSTGLAQVLTRLGEPLFLDPVPTGFPERGSAWMNTGAMLDRANTSLALARGQLPGVHFDADALLAAGLDRDALLARADDVVLQGAATTRTMTAIRDALGGVRDAHQARVLVIAMLLGSPDFQYQ